MRTSLCMQQHLGLCHIELAAGELCTVLLPVQYLPLHLLLQPLRMPNTLLHLMRDTSE